MSGAEILNAIGVYALLSLPLFAFACAVLLWKEINNRPKK